MVAFVLHDAGVESLHTAVYRPAVLIRTPIAQSGKARHHPAQTGNTEAAFPILFDFFCEGYQLWIHQHCVWHFLRIGLAGITIHIKYHDLKFDSNLLCSQSGAIQRFHGVVLLLNKGI